MFWLTWRWDPRLSFCHGGGSGYKDVLSEIALLDNIFNILAERLALRSSVSIVVVKRIVVSRFVASKIAGVCLWILHPGQTFDGIEDVLDRELQRGETVRYLVSSGLAL